MASGAARTEQGFARAAGGIDYGGSVDARPPDRFVVLDSFRGLSACIVALLHLNMPSHLAGLSLIDNGFLFVDFFFVLSGFVIAHSYASKLRDGFGLTDFMVLRMGRIVPLHVALLFAYAVMVAAAAARGVSIGGETPLHGPFGFGPFLATLSFVQIFGIASSWNPPSWSIAAEMWAYLVFGLIFSLEGRRVMAFAVVIVLVAGISQYLAFGTLPALGPGSLPRCLIGFGVGVVANRMLREGWVHAVPRRFATLAELLAIVGIAAAVMTIGERPVSFVMPLLFAAMILIFVFERGGISRLLRTAPFTILGMLSFSIYLDHFLLHKIFDNISNRFFSQAYLQQNFFVGDVIIAVKMACVLISAWITYRFVERPGQHWSRRLVGARRNAIAAERSAPTM